MKKILGLFSIMTLGACTHIEPGHVGVEINSCSSGGVDPNPVPIGYHMTGPCTTIEEFPVFQQTLILSHNPAEGNAQDESINVNSSEGLPIGVDSALSFTIEPGQAPHIYTKYKKSIEEIKMISIRQLVREVLQEIFAKYTAQQLYSDKKEFARAEVQGLLTKKLAIDGFNVTQFTINETRVPNEVLDAIKNKVAMTQTTQQAQQEVLKAQADASKKVAVAQGDADAMKLHADAEAYSNRKIAESLSPVLVHYKLAGKWDGRLSQVSGSTGNMLFNLDSVSK